MAGVRRILRDVTKTVSGVLAARPGEGGGQAALVDGHDEGTGVQPREDTGGQPAGDTGGQPPGDTGRQPAGEDGTQPAGDGAAEPLAEAGQQPAEVVAQQAAQTAPDADQELEGTSGPDPVLAAAVDLARAVAVEAGGDAVGDHLGVEVEGPEQDGPVLTHSFATTDPAYVGWRWAVTVARAAGSDRVTVDEVVLLPGSGALLAPAWVPWSERVQPGDLSTGDLLPAPADDPRLVPAYASPEDELVTQVWLELGLGRPRVLSVEGRADAAERWWEGEAGPHAPVAKNAPGQCVDCGFLVPLGGALRQAFGACANALAPDDGRVVALAHGCGAHSETVVEAAHAATSGMAVEHDELELLPVGESDPV